MVIVQNLAPALAVKTVAVVQAAQVRAIMHVKMLVQQIALMLVVVIAAQHRADRVAALIVRLNAQVVAQ